MQVLRTERHRMRVAKEATVQLSSAAASPRGVRSTAGTAAVIPWAFKLLHMVKYGL